MIRKFSTIFCMYLIASGVDLAAQSAQATMAAVLRTFMIQTATERGSAFSIDVDNREYFITAKHLFTGVKSGPAGEYGVKNVKVNVLSQDVNVSPGQNQQWVTADFSVIDPGKDVDILVLAPVRLITPGGASLKADSGVGLGADCEFLGFPYGGGWKAQFAPSNKWIWMPYVKHCTVSALNSEGLKIWVLDGINNEGFSGGPVIFGTGEGQKVFAVISGFHQEVLEVMPLSDSKDNPSGFLPNPPDLPGTDPKKPKKQIVNANSGFIIAFDIQVALDAIRANPIGPLRTPAPNSPK